MTEKNHVEVTSDNLSKVDIFMIRDILQKHSTFSTPEFREAKSYQLVFLNCYNFTLKNYVFTI